MTQPQPVTNNELNRALGKWILTMVAVKVTIYFGLRMLARKLSKSAEGQA